MPAKSVISSALRQLRLLGCAEMIRFHFYRFKYRAVNNKFKKDHPGINLPPDFFIYETYRLNFEEYYNDGKGTATEIVNLLNDHYPLQREGIRILDWGCGPGRITRHLPALLPGAALYATDYNRKYINWCRQGIKGVSFSLNRIDPPTDYPGSFFNALIGLSVFTHLSEKNHEEWINELYRILVPGGIVFFTTQGNSYREKLLPSERTTFDAGQLVMRSGIKEGNRLYSAFQPPEWMRKQLRAKFEIMAFIPGALDRDEPEQDRWLIKKISGDEDQVRIKNQ